MGIQFVHVPRTHCNTHPPSRQSDDAFHYCSRLTTAVVLRDEIEEFVSKEPIGGWWNDYPRVHEKRPRTYCFLVRCNIQERLGLGRSTQLQTNIHRMLRGIRSISPEGLGFYFDSIDSKLSAYENLTLLELAMKIKNHRAN